MKKLLLIVLILATTLAFGQKKTPGQPVQYSWLPARITNFINSWISPVVIYAFNSRAATCSVGQVVVWDNAKTLIDSIELDGTASDTFTLADSLATFRWWQLRFKSLNAIADCSLYIAGKDSTNTAQTETIVMAGGADTVAYSTNKWREIDLIYADNHAANDTVVVYAVPWMSVTTTSTEASDNVAGVIYESALTDSVIKVVINGFFQAYVLGSTELIPGMYIETGTTAGYGIGDATPVVGKGLGTILEWGNADGLYWININPAY